MRLLAELQRRNVHRAAIFYAGAAWLIVQIATQVFPFFDIPNSTVRIVVIAVVVGFPFAMLFSWFYEITPDGVKRESEIDHSQPVARQAGRWLDRGIIAVLALAVVLLLADRMAARKVSGQAGEKSIAVLPFANTSGDAGNEYFSDGLSEELISSLSRLGALKVIGRTSSFQFKGRTGDSRAIGEKLGVLYLLEGSVRKSADHVRIAVELVRAADGTNLWAESYDRELRDIFTVQSEIANAVAAQLKIALLGGESLTAPMAASRQNAEAYNALLQGNYYFQRRTIEDDRKAIGYYEEALRLNPDYALAWARLSSTQTLMVTTIGTGDEAGHGVLEKARAAADTALRLAPNLGEAHYARAILLQNADLDWVGAEVEFQRSLDLLPRDPLVLLGLGFRKAAIGRFDESVALYRRMVSVDPLFTNGLAYFARTLVAQAAYDEAEATLRKSIELQPQGAQNYMQLAVMQILRGNAPTAVDLAKQEPNPFWRNYALALSRFASGDRAEADAQLQTLIRDNASVGAAQIAAVYALRQEPDQMFEWLERAWIAHDPGVFLVRVDPFLSRYQGDPRYAPFCRKIGLPGPDASP